MARSGEALYGPIADRFARQYGVDPALFRRLVTQESGWRPDARSPAGAIGLTQVVPRWHPRADLSTPESQLEYGARHFGSLLRKYGNPRDALSVYNSGRPWSRGQSIPETRNYVSRILGGYAGAGTSSGGASVPPAGAAPTAAVSPPAAVPALSSRVFNAIQQYVQQSERDVLEGRMPGDVLPIIRMIQKETRARGTGPAAQTPSAPVAAGVAGSSAVQAGRFTSPWGGVSAPIIGRPGAGTHTLGNWQSDNAIDVRLPVGTPLYAPSDGVIGPKVGLLGSQTGGRFDGYRFTLQGAGNAWWFGHLQRLAPHIRPGARVTAGQLVGYSGSANGVPHLHLGVQSGNPLALLGLR